MPTHEGLVLTSELQPSTAHRAFPALLGSGLNPTLWGYLGVGVLRFLLS